MADKTFGLVYLYIRSLTIEFIFFFGLCIRLLFLLKIRFEAQTAPGSLVFFSLARITDF